ncbi:MAG: SMC-Scp complex subunit ScpB [Bacillota bacterium]|nr:SMC-Scp complex subunit ScpB [Bacillota bacterium]
MSDDMARGLGPERQGLEQEQGQGLEQEFEVGEAQSSEPVAGHELAAVLEALLFASGDPLDLVELADLTGHAPDVVESVLERQRREAAEDPGRGIELRRVGSRYSLATKPGTTAWVSRLFEPRHRPRLTPAAYETLAIVAYNQPVTRAQIEFVRGVNSDSIVSRLEERGYIEVVGQLETPGRPSLFATTERFLLETGLSGPEELPPMEMLMYDTLQSFEHEFEQSGRGGADSD